MQNGSVEKQARVSQVTAEGVWLHLGKTPYFLSGTDFPWFRDKPEASVKNVIQDLWGDLHWPDLDVDLELDSLVHPGKYPLVML